MSPSDIMRALVIKVARDDTRAGRASLVKEVRSILKQLERGNFSVSIDEGNEQ